MKFKIFFKSINKCLNNRFTASLAACWQHSLAHCWIQTWIHQRCKLWLFDPCCFLIFAGSPLGRIRMVFGSLRREVFCLLMSCCLFFSCLREWKSSWELRNQNQLVLVWDRELQISCLKFFSLLILFFRHPQNWEIGLSHDGLVGVTQVVIQVVNLELRSCAPGWMFVLRKTLIHLGSHSQRLNERSCQGYVLISLLSWWWDLASRS